MSRFISRIAPTMARGADFVVLCFIVAPAAAVILSLIFGGILSAAEQW